MLNNGFAARVDSVGGGLAPPSRSLNYRGLCPYPGHSPKLMTVLTEGHSRFRTSGGKAARKASPSRARHYGLAHQITASVLRRIVANRLLFAKRRFVRRSLSLSNSPIIERKRSPTGGSWSGCFYPPNSTQVFLKDSSSLLHKVITRKN